MIEELTPRLLSSLLLVLLIVASVLTLALSGLALWRYRSAVTGQMARVRGFVAGPSATAAVSAPLTTRDSPPQPPPPGAALYRQAVRGPWRVALGYAAGGLAFALAFAVAAHFVYGYRLGVPGFLVGVWIYLWPAVLALLLIVPLSWRVVTLPTVGYFTVFLLLILWAGTVKDIPAMQFGAMSLPARSSATPVLTLKLWLVVNAVPTVLVALCFNRWVRAVAPLVLSMITIAVSGLLVAYLALFSGPGTDAAVAVSVALDVHVVWLVVGTLLLALAVFGVAGWALARWLARVYRRGAISDQSLLLDALWLVFATFYAMWLAFGGVVWTATAPAALVAYKAVLAVARRTRVRTAPASRGLTFLRVFALGRRSERLLETLARYWRQVGSVQMITGPDVAHSTVQPHQFLDFLTGKLAAHFVYDDASLERSVAEWDRTPDKDGRFRINNFFCHADSWQAALPWLVGHGEVVLMDLRSFSATHAGCVHELEHLVAHVPVDQCLLLVDRTTDLAFVGATLQRAWQDLPAHSPNRGRSPGEAPLHRFNAGAGAMGGLVQRLCHAGTITTAR